MLTFLEPHWNNYLLLHTWRLKLSFAHRTQAHRHTSIRARAQHTSTQHASTQAHKTTKRTRIWYIGNSGLQALEHNIRGYNIMGARRAARKHTSTPNTCTPLIFIDLSQPNVREYGVHWNFWFTLAVVNMLFNLIPIPIHYGAFFGAALMAGSLLH